MISSSTTRVVSQRPAGLTRLLSWIAAAVLLATAGPPPALASPNSDGVTGLLSVPTAEVVPEGMADFSYGRHLSDLINNYPGALIRVYSVSLGYLPGLEISGRLSEFPQIPDLRNNVESLLDRSVSAKYRFYSSEDLALAIGAIDVGGQSRIDASYYGAATYTGVPQWEFTAGAGNEQFDGFFGGARWTPGKLLSLIGEYNADSANYGVELRPLTGVTLKGGMVEGHSAFSASYRIQLDPRGHDTLCCPAELEDTGCEYGSPCEEAAAIRDALVAEGFENVLVGASADSVYAAFESRRFREQLDALGVAAAVVAAYSSSSIESVVLVPKLEDVPVLKVRTGRQELFDFFNTPDQPGCLAVEDYSDTGYAPDLEFAPEAAKKPGGGDLQLRLTSSLVLNQPGQPAFRTQAGVGLEEHAYLGRGLTFKARQDWPVFNEINDKHDPLNRDAYLTYFTTVADSTFLYGAGGYLGAGEHGGKVELAHYFDRGRYKLAAQQSYVASDSPTDSSDSSLLGEVAYFAAEHDLQLSAKAGEFIEGDLGVKLEATRYFGPTELTFFAYDTDESPSQGGFRVFVSLPWFSDNSRGSWRAEGAPYFAYQYRTDADPFGSEILPAETLDRARQRLNPLYVSEHLNELRRAVALHQPACVRH